MQNYHDHYRQLMWNIYNILTTNIEDQNISKYNITWRGPCQTWPRLRQDSWASEGCWEWSPPPPRQALAPGLGPASSPSWPGRWRPPSALTWRMSPPSSCSGLIWADLPITKICQFGHQTTVGLALPQNEIRLPFRLENWVFSALAIFLVFIIRYPPLSSSIFHKKMILKQKKHLTLRYWLQYLYFYFLIRTESFAKYIKW